MTYIFIIVFCILILLAYIFDLTTHKTRIPSVILLLFLGWAMGEVTRFFEISMPNLKPLLPILGTIGLIVIVLEGSLELDFNKSKLAIVRKSLGLAFFSVLTLGLIFTGTILYYRNYLLPDGAGGGIRVIMLNVIPLAIISSSVAIPGVINLSRKNRELVTFESSLSDIFGVILFDFIARNTVLDIVSIGFFFLQLAMIALISIFGTIGLSYLLGRIDHKIKFIPLLILAILVYSVAEIYRLPALIFILLFGLILGNLDQMKHFRLLQKKDMTRLKTEVRKFHGVTREATFLVRSMFFLLFGFFIQTSEILNEQTIIPAAGIVVIILIVRLIFLKIYKLEIHPLIFIIPRGLVTILLFLSINAEDKISVMNNSLLIQVIVLSVLVMMTGLLFANDKKREKKQTKLSTVPDAVADVQEDFPG